MIVQLTPVQISEFWEMIKHGVVVCSRVPKVNQQNHLNKILENLLTGKAQAWVGYAEREGKKVFHAFGLTDIHEDTFTGVTRLCLQTLYAFRPIPEDMLLDIIPMLEQYAMEIGCTGMFTFTEIPRLQEYYKSQGFNQNLALYVKDF